MIHQNGIMNYTKGKKSKSTPVSTYKPKEEVFQLN